MKTLRSLWVRLINGFKKNQQDDELAAELAGHLAMHIENNLRSGMSPDEARRNALLKLGGLDRTSEECRDVRRFSWFEGFVRDLSYGFRQMRRSPGFALVAILTLALGIGAITSFFSVVNAVLFRPLPFPHPEQLVQLNWDSPTQRYYNRNPLFGSEEFLTLKNQSQTLAQIVAYGSVQRNLSTKEEAARVNVGNVSADFFSMLGVQPQFGRSFLADEDQSTAGKVAVLSHDFWAQRFGSDGGILGKSVDLDGGTYTIVGILPPRFYVPDIFNDSGVDLWIPLTFERKDSVGNPPAVFLIGLLKAEMGLEAARAELEGILHTVRRGAAKRLLLMGWRQEFTDKARLPLLLFLGAVGFVFVIVCCNIANLMLARSTARGREILIRSSLGASRSRIARQILTECMFLSVLGGFIGFAMAFWGKDLLQFVWSEDLAPVPFIPVDHRVLGFVLLLSIIAGLVFGMAPILATYRMRFSERLNGGSYAGSRPVQQIGRLLVTLEVALALVLLIGAGLLLKSLILLQRTNPGYRPEQILSLTVDLTPARYPVPRRQSEFFQASVAKISVLPSVESVAASTSIPLGLMTISASGLEIEGSKTEERPLGDRPLYLFAAVSSGYFRILGIPLLRGRVLDENDREGAPAVAVISNAFAHQYFPNQDPLGCRVRTAFPRGEWVTVVGVVGDVHAWGLDGEVRPQLYRSYLQWTVPHMSLLVRSSSDSTRLVHDIRACIASIDPNQPIFDVKSMEERLSRSMLTPRVNLGLLGTFALTAVLLACMGIYGIVSHLVSRRTNEIGIRMALGARSGDVLQMVVSQSMRMCGLGILIGVAGALYVTRYISSLLYQTKPIDLPIFIALALLLVIIAFFASFLPARKAARVDPMKALRYE